MNYLQALLLSAVEGITEFLPVSSTGHLILVSDILKISQSTFVKDFEIVIQLGAILAVVILYWNNLFKSKEIWKRIIVAFIPTGIIGFALFKIIKIYLLGNLYVTLMSLFIGGFILIFLELIYKEKEHHLDDISEMSFANAFLIGIFQSLSVIPGVSRSAATIISASFLGTKRKAAVEFSFLLAIPTMLAATGLDIVKSNFSYNANEWLLMLTGFAGSFIVALIIIKWFLKYVQNHSFIPFGIYRIIVAIIFYIIILR